MSAPLVYGLGQCSLDYLTTVAAYPAVDGKVEFDDLVVSGGGPVATAMVALSRWGISCAFAGVVGDDAFGTQTRASLADEDVDLKGLRFPPNDLKQTLAQQLLIMETARRVAANVHLPKDTSVLVGMGTAAEIAHPPGGIFQWVRLPPAVDALALAQAAAREGIAINPGPEWSTDAAAAHSSLRICFANAPDEVLREGVARLAAVCQQLTGVPERIANR